MVQDTRPTVAADGIFTHLLMWTKISVIIEAIIAVLLVIMIIWGPFVIGSAPNVAP